MFQRIFSKKYFCNVNRRVVVTGMGMVTPLGLNKQETWKNLKEKQSGIKDLSEESFGKELPSNCKFGAMIPKRFDGRKFRTLGTDNLLTQITLAAAEEALKDAKYSQAEFKDNKKLKYRTGVYVGSSLPSLNCITESIKKAHSNDYTHINRMLMLRMLTNLLASNISIKYDLRGPLLSPTLACATSLNAIGESYNIIKNNDADVMICGGSENSIHPLVFHSMNKLNTLYSSNKNFSAQEASRPFDVDRAGFIIGEGSGILVLEELNHALKRNADIYCEIKGYATFGDAFHMTKPTLDGEGGFRAMAKCLIDANKKPGDINFINAHATSTEIGDVSELNALKNLFGNRKFEDLESLKKSYEECDFNFALEDKDLDKDKLQNLIINCNKAQIGHLLGAAGSVESIISILSLKDNFFLDNINTYKPVSSLFKLRYDRNDITKHNLKYVMKNSFAFGGVNTSILFEKV